MSLFVEESLEAYSAYNEWSDVIDVFKENKDRLPAFRFDCGARDELIEPNRLLHQQLLAAGIAHSYEEFE
jgi:enterochelin esterase-like enzyme